MDKRKDKRWELNKINRISIAIDDEMAELIDLSRDGMQLVIPFYPKNRHLELQVRINEEPFDVKGYIHWLSESTLKEGKNQMGVSVVDAPEAYFQAIEKILTIY